MDNIAIKAKNLSKRYHIGALKKRYNTLGDTLNEKLRLCLQGFKRQNNNGNDFIWALKSVSFEIKKGETVGIIGRNGAGKSTLLKILSRITRPTEGYADVHGLVGSLLEVGTGFHQELTGRENVYLNGAILGMRTSVINRKFDEIVAFAELEKFIDTPVKYYSSGMRVRLAFAVAAHLEPEILLIDEVLAVGDAAFQKKCLGKMDDVAKEGRTVLFVSHNMSAITRLCKRAILLEAGTIVKDGTPEETVGLYLENVFSAGHKKVWDDINRAPGTEELKLFSVSVSKEDGTQARVISVEESIKVALEYYVGVPNLRFRCTVIFKTQGVVAFASLEPREFLRKDIGIYRSTVTVPGNLLTEGEYTVSLSIFSSRGVRNKYIKESDIIAFQVYDPITGSSARGDYTEDCAGVVMPLLKWEEPIKIRDTI